MKDGTGREFDDDLTTFLEWYLEAGLKIFTPMDDAVHFVENVVGTTIYRHGQFQVQLFTATPNTVIPEHLHPNVDSYEVALTGMGFTLEGKTVLPMFAADTKCHDSDLSIAHYSVVRVLPESLHGALAGPKGGAFMSVQHWLNGVKPTSVGNDWNGEATMGDSHTEQVTTTEEIPNF